MSCIRIASLCALAVELVTQDDLDGIERVPGVCLYEVGVDRIVRRAFCAGAANEGADKLGRSALELVPPQERANLQERLRDSFAMGRVGKIRYAVPRPGRDDRVLEARVSPAGPGGSVPESVHLAIVDVTDLAAENLRARRRNAELETLLDTYMIVLLDANARVRYVNDSVERVLGLRVNEYVGSHALDCVHPDDVGRARATLSELLAVPGQPKTLALRARHRDGGWRWLELAARNLLQAPGLGAIVVNIRDETDRWFAEQRLQAQERRFRALIENDADAIALLSPQGTIGYASPSHAQVLGQPADSLLGANLLDLVAAESRDSLRALLDSAIDRPGESLLFETRALEQDGARRHLEGYLTNLLDVPGVEAIVCNCRDVTERVHQQLSLEKAHREADMFRRMVDLSSQAIGTADMEARVLYQNPALLRLLGNSSLESAQERSYEDYYRPEDLKYLRNEVIGTVLAEGHWTGELELQPLGGKPLVPTIQSVYLLRDDQGRPIAFSNVITDISEQKRTELALRASEAKYRGLVEDAPFGIAVADVQTGEILDCNPAMCQMVGRSRDALIGQHQRIFHPQTVLVRGVSPSFELHRSGRHELVRDERLITATGEIRYVEIKASSVDWGGRNALQGVFHDITDRKRAEEALLEEKERAQVTLHSIGDAVIATGEHGRIDFMNPVAEDLTGWRCDEALGRDLDDVFRTRDEIGGEPRENPIARCLREGHIADMSSPMVLIGRDGSQYDIDASASPIRRSDGTVLGAVLVFHDVSEARQLTRKMAYDAAHDPLTGLFNRRELEDRLGKALKSAHEHGIPHALCYIDLDQFKIVNDSAGHAAGDEVLKQIKGMLEGLFRDRDTLARLGGDEFGLLLDNCPIGRAVSIANRIVDAIRAHRFVWDGRSYRIGASIGVTAISSESESVANLLSQADVACYTAKELGRNRVHLYHEEGGAPIKRHSEILQAAELRDALDLNRFRLYCQRIVPLKDDEPDCLRYELLLRLVDRDGNLVWPGAFIPAAERFGLMGELDRWVIRTAFESYATVFDGRQARISVNLSGNSLNDDTLLDYVRDQLKAFELAPERVCFEITETAAMHDVTRASRVLSELRDMGCQLALDDFGSGLSSLRYLKELPVDYLKIDGSFVEGLADDSGDQAIVAAVNQLAHRLGIRTIAEYASSDRIVDKLRTLSVDFAQGYAVGYPLPFSEIGVSQ